MQVVFFGVLARLLKLVCRRCDSPELAGTQLLLLRTAHHGLSKLVRVLQKLVEMAHLRMKIGAARLYAQERLVVVLLVDYHQTLRQKRKGCRQCPRQGCHQRTGADAGGAMLLTEGF